jgi:hypothetical protein
MPTWQQQLMTYPVLSANVRSRGSGQTFRRPYALDVIVDPVVDAVVAEILDPVLIVAELPVWLDPSLPYGRGRRWHMSRTSASANTAAPRPARSLAQSTRRR